MKDPSGKRIGAIEGVMLDKLTRNVMFAVVGFGGLVGVADTYQAIPWSALEFHADEDAYIVNSTSE